MLPTSLRRRAIGKEGRLSPERRRRKSGLCRRTTVRRGCRPVLIRRRARLFGHRCRAQRIRRCSRLSFRQRTERMYLSASTSHHSCTGRVSVPHGIDRRDNKKFFGSFTWKIPSFESVAEKIRWIMRNAYILLKMVGTNFERRI